jgi:hypothetical protein
MTLPQQKLNQLNLATMSLHLDQTLTDTTARNLSPAQTLEALLDRELEARRQRSDRTALQTLALAEQAFHRHLPL